MRCKTCKKKFTPKYFLQKTCGNDCEVEYRSAKPKKHIKPISEKMSKQLKIYTLKRTAFMLSHKNCERCHVEATDVHHKAGRIGKLLVDQTKFMAVCRACHNYIHENQIESREKGWVL